MTQINGEIVSGAGNFNDRGGLSGIIQGALDQLGAEDAAREERFNNRLLNARSGRNLRNIVNSHTVFVSGIEIRDVQGEKVVRVDIPHHLLGKFADRNIAPHI